MPQLHLPAFPSGATDITLILSFARTDDTVTYFHHGLPIYSHDKADRASFRQIVAALHVHCGASQADLASAFGIPAISIKRAVKLLRAAGAKGFYAARVSRGAAVLTTSVLAQAQSQLDSGEPPRAVADVLGIKPDTLSKAIRAGRLHAPPKKKQLKAQKTPKTPKPLQRQRTTATVSLTANRAAKAHDQAKTTTPPWDAAPPTSSRASARV